MPPALEPKAGNSQNNTVPPMDRGAQFLFIPAKGFLSTPVHVAGNNPHPTGSPGSRISCHSGPQAAHHGEYEVGLFTGAWCQENCSPAVSFYNRAACWVLHTLLTLVKNTQKRGLPASESPECPPKLQEDVQKLHMYSQK